MTPSSFSQILYENVISLRSSFLVMSLCSILHLLRTFLPLPRTHIPYPLPQHYTYGWESGSRCRWSKGTSSCINVHFHLVCRLNCGQATTCNTEQLEQTRDGSVTVLREPCGQDSVPAATEDGTEVQDSEKGIDLVDSRTWFIILTVHRYVISNENTVFVSTIFQTHDVSNTTQLIFCSVQPTFHALGFIFTFTQAGIIKSHPNMFSCMFLELCAVLALPVAPAVVVHHAAETLPLHWHTRPNAQPAGQQWSWPG